MKPVLKKEKLDTLLEARFINVYDHPFGENGHYLTASRRKKDDLVMFKSEEEYKNMYPDAVTMIVIITAKNREPAVLMNYEFRYPTGEFILAPPAGLIDPEDLNSEDPILTTARREIEEETGISLKDTDSLHIVNPLLFSSPGMTDESNAIVCAIIDHTVEEDINYDNIKGSEVFNGFELLTKEQAINIIKTGKDKNQYPYSVYTWIGLMYFISDLWKN
ncbi:MAG: NUDIX hydrolase [Lachnospiraceae bacterium]|nr:NUDIX hydrolase [Lachnospiraceae bacterium]